MDQEAQVSCAAANITIDLNRYDPTADGLNLDPFYYGSFSVYSTFGDPSLRRKFVINGIRARDYPKAQLVEGSSHRVSIYCQPIPMADISTSWNELVLDKSEVDELVFVIQID